MCSAVRSCEVVADRWVQTNLAVRSWSAADRWSACVTHPVRFTPVRSASWLLVVDRSRQSKSVEVRGVWEICDDPVGLVNAHDVFRLDAADV